eukprot:gene12831-15062_t
MRISKKKQGGGDDANERPTLPASYPKRQFAYMEQLANHSHMTLKQRCFVTIANSLFDPASRTQDGSMPAWAAPLSTLPLELKEELVHFMLEYRLFNTQSLTSGVYGTPQFMAVLDTRIRALDFSIVRSKIAQNEPTKELLRLLHTLQRLDLSYCYEITDSILKIVVSSQSSSRASGETMDGGGGGGGSNCSSATTTPASSPKPSRVATTTLQRLKEKILKKRKHTDISQQEGKTAAFKQNLRASNLNASSITTATTSSGNSTNSNNSNGHNNEDETSSNSLTLSSMDLDPNATTMGLEFVSLRQCTAFSDGMLRKLFRVAPMITYLDITGTKASTKTLLTITSTCTRLRTLAVSTLNNILTPVTMPSFSRLASLTNLDLSYLSDLDSDALDIILTPAAPLSPSTRRPTMMHSPSVQSISSISSSSLGEASNLRTMFPASLLRLNLAQSDIDNEAMGTLARRCPNLQSLDLSFCSRIGDAGLGDLSTIITTLTSLTLRLVKASSGIADLARTNPALTHLDARFTQLNEAHITQLSHHLTGLSTLRLDGTPVTDAQFDAIAAANRGLETIGLSQCKNLTCHIAAILAARCPLLTRLFLAYSRLGGKVDIPAVEALFDKCRRLTTLDICFTPLVCDQALLTLARSRTAANLDSLFIGGGFQQLNNDVVACIVTACPRMRIFSCKSCYTVKDAPILAALRKWLLLEAIELTDCTALTPDTINFVAQDTHVHFHLRFVFFGSAVSEVEIDEQAIFNKIEGKTTIEVLDTQQQLSLEDLIEQGWISL